MTAKIRSRFRVSGTSALAMSTVISNLLRIVSTVCLTRLLAPEVYGITGMIMSVFYMINMVTDIGLQAYVVRHQRSDEPDFLSSVYTIHAVRGVGLALIGMALAWPLAFLLQKPALAVPLFVSSLVLVIDGQVTLHQFIGLRDGRVQRYSMIDLISSASQTLSAIAFAFVFRNVWAIIASMFVASAAKVWAGYSLFPGSSLRYRLDRDIAADLWRFSKVIAVSSALTLMIGQIDKLVLARSLPLSQFGIYVIAASLAGAPVAFAANYAAAIVYPAAAVAARDVSSIAEAYYRSWGRFFYLYAFGGGALIGVADLLIRLLYDPRYLSAAFYLSILAVSTALAMTTRAMESVQVASGRPRVALQFNALRIACLLGAAILALAQGQPLFLIAALGLLEIPVYFFGLFRMGQLHEIRWLREASLAGTIVAGVIAGRLTDMAALALFPRL